MGFLASRCFDSALIDVGISSLGLSSSCDIPSYPNLDRAGAKSYLKDCNSHSWRQITSGLAWLNISTIRLSRLGHGWGCGDDVVDNDGGM